MSHSELPLGFGAALVQNRAAMEYFSSLSQSRQCALLEQAREITNSTEMYNFVRSLASTDIPI